MEDHRRVFSLSFATGSHSLWAMARHRSQSYRGQQYVTTTHRVSYNVPGDCGAQSNRSNALDGDRHDALVIQSHDRLERSLNLGRPIPRRGVCALAQQPHQTVNKNDLSFSLPPRVQVIKSRPCVRACVSRLLT